ncbi:MAG: S-layer homology domain-containing protein [Lachnospirales bacterium]
MIKRFFALFMVCTFVVSTVNFVYADTESSVSDEELGELWGQIYGYAYGHEDFVDDDYINPTRHILSFSTSMNKKFDFDTTDSNDVSTEFKENFDRYFQVYYDSGFDGRIVGFETGEEKYPKDSTSAELGESWGLALGNFDGNEDRADGSTAIHNRKSAKLNSRLTGEYDLSETYMIGDTSDANEDAFKSAFEKAYSTGYDTGVKGELVVEVEVDDSFAGTYETLLQFSYDIGYSEGAMAGEAVYANGKVYDFEGELAKYKSRNDFIKLYDFDKYANLEFDNQDFLDQFDAGFYAGYNNIFVNYYTDFQNKNKSYIEIGPSGINFAINGEGHTSVVQNNVTEEVYTTMRITIPENAAYGHQYFEVYEIPQVFMLEDRFIPLRTAFYVDGSSDYNGIQKDSANILEDWTISFDFTGSFRAGIYKKEGSKWVYQNTEYDGSNLTTTIPYGEFTDGQYTVLIDSEFKEIKDINNNWASGPLYVYLRRGLLDYNTSTNMYYPNNYMTRGEFTNMFKSVVENKVYPSTSKGVPFTDVAENSKYYDGVKYCYSQGYMVGVSDTLFNVNGNLTYNQLETIIRRAYGDSYNIQDSLLKMNQDFYKSKGERDKNGFVTRSEVVFILYDVWN